MFVYLYNVGLVDAFSQSKGQHSRGNFIDKGFTGSDLLSLSLWLSIAGFIGLLFAFIVSVVVSVRRRWFWVNALIVSVAIYFLYVFRLLGWEYVGYVFGFPGSLLNNTAARCLTTGVILLTIGLLILFSKRTEQFVGNNKPVAV
jgi:hypothetical protein